MFPNFSKVRSLPTRHTLNNFAAAACRTSVNINKGHQKGGEVYIVVINLIVEINCNSTSGSAVDYPNAEMFVTLSLQPRLQLAC